MSAGKPEHAEAARPSSVTPFFFGPDERLFGVYDPPTGRNVRADGIVIANPIGHEYVRSHRGCRQLARQLALAGFPVLRFDYFGTGETVGDDQDGDIDRWTEDILAAVDHLGARHRRVGVVGLRLGATLAMRIGERTGELASLALWRPVVDGPRHRGRSRNSRRSRNASTGGRNKSPCVGRESKEVSRFSVSRTPRRSCARSGS